MPKLSIVTAFYNEEANLPELRPRLLEQWRAGHDVVWAARAAREQSSWLTGLTAHVYYALMRRWALPDLPRTGADFLLMDRKVLDALRSVSARHSSLLGLI